jgi:Rieske Fe-S protein
MTGLVGLAAIPFRRPEARRWRRAVSIFDLPVKTPVALVIGERHADGWHNTRRDTTVFIDRVDGAEYRALLARCTHLGCRVGWNAEAGEFRCPCHGGAYDREGRVVAGPPPAPLARLNVRVNPETSDIEVEL